MGWRHPAARHGQQRRGYSGQTSERSRDVVVGRVTFEVQGRRKTGLAAVSIVFEALQAVYTVLSTSRGRAAAAPVVVPLAMVASRLSFSRRHGANSRGRLRLHRTSDVLVDKLPELNLAFRLNSAEKVFFHFLVEFDFS